MATIEEIRQRIAVVNSESAKVNNKRNQNIGMRDTLEKQCADLIANYQSTYGVQLSMETLDSEINKVVSEKERETLLLENVIGAINRGDFNTANHLLGVEEPKAPEVTIPQQEVVTPIQQETVVQQVESIPSPQGNSTPSVEQGMNFEMEDKVTLSVPPVSSIPTTPTGSVPSASEQIQGFGLPYGMQQFSTPETEIPPAPPTFAAPPAPPTSPAQPKPLVMPNSNNIVGGVQDIVGMPEYKAPIPAMEGFTRQSNQEPSAFAMPEVSSPPMPSGVGKATSFNGILGGSEFQTGN